MIPATNTEEYTCSSGHIISNDQVCDGIMDCPRGENVYEGEEEDNCDDGEAS